MMRMPQTSTYIRRSYVRGLAFSIDMEHQKERYRSPSARRQENPKPFFPYIKLKRQILYSL